MLTIAQAKTIINHLNILPPDKIFEVENYIIALKERYRLDTKIDDSEIWTDEDIQDLMAATLKHADHSL